MLKVYNCVNCTKDETCAMLHRFHVLYISDIKLCQKNMFDHYYCIVSLLLTFFLEETISKIHFLLPRHERCVGFKKGSFQAKTYMSS